MSSQSECKECEALEEEFKKNPGGVPIRNKGLALIGITGGAALALSALCVPFVTPALRRICLPFVPATSEQVSNVFKALRGRTGGSLVDIGSGDGRIVIEAAKRGFKAHGIELNPWLVLYSKYRAWRSGCYNTATFSRQDLWTSDLSRFDNVVIFGVEEMMPELESKLEKELNSSNALVVACRFYFPTWKPQFVQGEGIDTVWVYDCKSTPR